MRTFPIPGTYKSARVAVPANRKPEARLDDGGLFHAKGLKKCLTIEGARRLRDQLRCWWFVLARPSDSGVGFAAPARRLGW